MQNKHNQHIGIYHQAFSKEYCDRVITSFDENSDLWHSRKEGTHLKKDQQFFMHDENVLHTRELHHEFNEQFYNGVYKEYIKEYPALDESGYNFNRFFKVQKTKPSEGYHQWHHECHSDTRNRLAVWTLYLNDNFEAGETEFLYQQIRVKPETGMVCIFPASYTHVHRGNPPIGGTKYIATGWIEF